MRDGDVRVVQSTTTILSLGGGGLHGVGSATAKSRVR